MHSRNLPIWLTAAVLSLLALAAGGAEQLGALRSIRPALLDACSPGRVAVLAISRWNSSGLADSNAKAETKVAATLQPAAASQELLLRQLLIENARLRRDIDRERKRTAQLLPELEPEAPGQRAPLVGLRMIPARVITRQDEFPEVLRELSITAGRSQGLNRSELVVQGAGRVIDAGREQRIEAGDRVLDGLTVVGRIERSGQWMSLVQPVTADGFRARVQLYRVRGSERHAGAVALLEGTGDAHCQLSGLGHTAAVAAGDEVFAAGIEGLAGPVLYFGRVVQADFLAAGEWDVRVAPAVQLDELDAVQVLRWEWLKTAAAGAAQ